MLIDLYIYICTYTYEYIHILIYMCIYIYIHIYKKRERELDTQYPKINMKNIMHSAFPTPPHGRAAAHRTGEEVGA